MGLFSSEKRTTVGTTVSRVIDNKLLPNAVQTGLLKALFSADPNADIPSYVLEELVTSVAVRAERMYDYAAKGNYVYGLPSGQFLVSATGRDEVQVILDGIEGTPVELDYVHIAPPNKLHSAWMYLVAAFGYNPVTNALPGIPVGQYGTAYVKDLVVSVPYAEAEQYTAEALSQWGPPARGGYTPSRSKFTQAAAALFAQTRVRANPNVSAASVTLVYEWMNPFQSNGEGVGTVHEYELVLPMLFLDAGQDYVQVRYSVGGEIKYWRYLVGSGGYPEIDALVLVPPTVAGTFFPFAYFRYNKTSDTTDKTTQAYKSSKKLVKYLGLDYGAVGEAIDENPDIADVEQAMLIMAVPAVSEHPLESRYLFDFFSNVIGSAPKQFNSRTQMAITGSFQRDPSVGKNSIIIQDSRFKMALNNQGISKKKVVGSIGAIGDCTSTTTSRMVNQEYWLQEEDRVMHVPLKETTHYYRRQDNLAMYDEIQVVNLRMVYHVYGEYTVTAGEDDDILLIPIDHSISDNYSGPEREILYSRSLHYVFNSRVVTKIKWYQQSWFSDLMMIAALAITVWTMGADGGALLGAIVAGNAAAISAAMIVIVTDILVGMVIGAALKIFVKLVGLEAAFVIAIVAAIYGGVQALKQGSIKGAPWAQELLSLSTGLTKAVGEALTGLMEDLLGEASDFTKYVEEQLKLLDSSKDLLKRNGLLNPFVIFGESPEQYFNRTVHSGNIGVRSVEAISSYVEIALTLPKIDETIGEQYNGYA